MTERHGDWIQTYTGRQVWPMDPRPGDFDILDIAHALSMTCRFSGHCEDFYSVAQHSVLVARSLPQEFQMQGLLHDASKAYINDIARPVKPYLENYCEVEKNIQRTIQEQFGLPWVLDRRVKAVDSAILPDEAETLMKAPPAPWVFYANPLGIDISPWPWKMARSTFLQAFEVLKAGGVLPLPDRRVQATRAEVLWRSKMGPKP